MIISAGVPLALAIESWVGPLNGIQDFELGTGALEVKATLSAVSFPAKIGSLEQLDNSTRQPLFLAGVRLQQIESGQNLPEIVGRIRLIVQGDAEAERLFQERLLATGYIDAHADRYPRRFVPVGMHIVEVTDDFPRLTSGNVPTGILKAMYEVDLEKTLREKIEVEDALRKLGVI